MTTVRAFFTVYPMAFLLLTALLGLVIGSFLNVVIHRLPIMLERLWQRQCEELGRQPAAET
ncbi:MAG: prepilin peptidase, partial [Pseudomonadota bacterium]